MRLILIVVLFLSTQAVLAAELKIKRSTHCALTRSLDIDQLVDDAGIIFKGNLVSVSYGKYDGLNVRNLQFKVLDPIKGVRGDTLKLREWAAVKTPLSEAIDKDRPYIFFFHKPSNRGLTSLIGMEQGLVEVNRDDELKYSSRLNLQRKNKLFATPVNLKSKTATSSSEAADLSTYAGLKEFCKSSAH